MTTIAYKDGVIAYDSRCTSGGTIEDDDFDKRVSSNGVEFFLTGATADHESLVALYEGVISEPRGRFNAAALVVDDGKLYLVSYNDEDGFFKSPKRLEVPHAIGSGQDHALTAMDMGADAKTAVKMAMKRDSGTGGRIRTFKVF